MYQSAATAAAKKLVSFQPSVSVKASGVADGSDAAVSQHDTTPDRQVSVTLAPLTPGVVGAQELYPDPRERMRSSHQQPYYMTPDRMTFGDKMRRFAAEAGEDTPIPKAKISRAQQRIEVHSEQQYWIHVCVVLVDICCTSPVEWATHVMIGITASIKSIVDL